MYNSTKCKYFNLCCCSIHQNFMIKIIRYDDDNIFIILCFTQLWRHHELRVYVMTTSDYFLFWLYSRFFDMLSLNHNGLLLSHHTIFKILIFNHYENKKMKFLPIRFFNSLLIVKIAILSYFLFKCTRKTYFYSKHCIRYRILILSCNNLLHTIHLTYKTTKRIIKRIIKIYLINLILWRFKIKRPTHITRADS